MSCVKAVVTSPVPAMETSKPRLAPSAFSPVSLFYFKAPVPRPKGKLSGERDSFSTADALNQGG